MRARLETNDRKSLKVRYRVRNVPQNATCIEDTKQTRTTYEKIIEWRGAASERHCCSGRDICTPAYDDSAEKKTFTKEKIDHRKRNNSTHIHVEVKSGTRVHVKKRNKKNLTNLKNNRTATETVSLWVSRSFVVGSTENSKESGGGYLGIGGAGKQIVGREKARWRKDVGVGNIWNG